MKPIRLPVLTETLGGGPAEKYGTDDDVLDLPVRRVDGSVISCWRASWWERIQILVSGRAWLVVRGNTHAPLYLSGDRSHLRAAPPEGEKHD